MATVVEDIIGGRGGYGGFGGGGCGDGGIGLLALLALTGGLGNRRDGRGDDCDSAAKLSIVADGINHNVNTSTMGILNQMNQGFDNIGQVALMSKLGSIEGAIPLAASQVELAVCNAAADINSNTTAGFAITNKNINDAETAILQSLCGIEKTVLTSAAIGVAATKDAQYAVTTAVRDDGDKTRAQIALYHEATLQRQLGVAESALAEERNSRRIRDVEVSMSQTVNQSNTQVQAQSQAQQQLQLMAGLLAEVRNLANDVQVVRQTQSNVNFGTQTGTAQTASAANNRVS